VKGGHRKGYQRKEVWKRGIRERGFGKRVSKRGPGKGESRKGCDMQ